MTIQLLPKSLLCPESNRLRCSNQLDPERRHPLATAANRDAALLPLWLTADEAELLLELCTHSRASAGEREEALFTKLGDLLRGFR